MLKLYNTVTRKIENFVPINKKEVGLYTCGPTVYNFAHIGNLRTYIFEDILKKTLEFNGYHVNHVMNITDVGHLTDDADSGEDKMEKGAKREQKTVWDIADSYTQAFKKDLADLNIKPPTTYCKATDHIPEQIELVRVLETKGFTYKTNDGIYFDTTKLADYGKLANLKGQELQAGARVEIGEKRNPHDFALWKFSPHGEKRAMEWESPWGIGFPGWHLECSAMATKYLGQPFDIHCGGIDHIPVHHTNEIAQSEAAFDKTLANYWMHGEFLIQNIVTCQNCKRMFSVKDLPEEIEEDSFFNSVEMVCPNKDCGKPISLKMAKSAGNFITLQTIKDKDIHAISYRYFDLQAHYRKQLMFSWEALQAAQTGLEHLYEKAWNLKKFTENETGIQEETISEFLDAINNDLNTPQALAILHRHISNISPGGFNYKTLLEMDKVLGLEIEKGVELHDATVKDVQSNSQAINLPASDYALFAQREEARTAKNWSESDRLRKELEDLGYVVEDTKEGTKIHKK